MSSLPARPNLEHLKKQAKKLLHELESRDLDAQAVYRDTIGGPLPTTPQLSDAPFLIARQHGFASWPRLATWVAETGDAAQPVDDLVLAVKKHNTREVRRLLEQFPALSLRLDDPLPRLAFGGTLLMAARPDRELIDVLLAAGADINQRSHWWAGSFGMLDEKLDPALVDWLVSRGATMDAYAAARHGRLDVLRALVARDPAVVRQGFGDGQAPLHVAASVEIAAFLLDHGADIDALDVDHESTAAQYLVKDRTDVTRYLVSRGAKTDILMASALGDLALVRRLLDADPDSIRTTMTSQYFPMRQGGSMTVYTWTIGMNKTPHAVAKDFGHEDVYAELMARSPDDLKLAVATELGDEAILRQLGNGKEFVVGMSAATRRRLVDAAVDENWDAVRRMLAAGWPVDATGQHGSTVLHWAAWHGNPEMAREILAFHPPLGAKDHDYGGTALGWAHHAQREGWHEGRGDYEGVIRVLREAGVPMS